MSDPIGLSWMAWTWQTGVFFAGIAAALLVMTGWELARPGGDPRRGVLGLNTTRGDRLFVSLLAGAWIHLGWLAFAAGPLWWASVIALAFALFVFVFI